MSRAAAVLVLAMSGAAIAGVSYMQRRAAGEGAAADPELAAGPGVLEQLEFYAAPIAETIKDLVGLGPTAVELQAMIQEPNIAAFLAMLRISETGTADARAYAMLFGGGQFSTFAQHPGETGFKVYERADEFIRNGKKDFTTAAGAYQITLTTWRGIVRALGLADFSPVNQDIAGAYLVRSRGALADVRSGRIQAAIAKCGQEWASLPGSPYGQPRKTLEQALALYESAGGSIA